MIKAQHYHTVTFDMSDEDTAELAGFIHNSHKLLLEGKVSKETYVELHNHFRGELETENLISFVGYKIDGESYEYTTLIAEFPVKNDGEIHSAKRVDNEDGSHDYYLLSTEEAIFEALENATKGEK